MYTIPTKQDMLPVVFVPVYGYVCTCMCACTCVVVFVPVWVLASHHGHPAGGAGGLDVVLVQQHPGAGQFLQHRAVNQGVVPGDVVPA